MYIENTEEQRCWKPQDPWCSPLRALVWLQRAARRPSHLTHDFSSWQCHQDPCSERGQWLWWWRLCRRWVHSHYDPQVTRSQERAAGKKWLFRGLGYEICSPDDESSFGCDVGKQMQEMTYHRKSTQSPGEKLLPGGCYHERGTKSRKSKPMLLRFLGAVGYVVLGERQSQSLARLALTA